ncbi:hypothetical protein HB662_03925 [Roseomonas frigidaquae]|uniref:Uncharacterized protein n=1 Tax=Falsiroseomonas frigidaquae TaxID=487318 RepID=A0ABX1EWJ4_9PROT|nr:hypothetical protein [Falsiroseomonas frigidaquae]NKE43912.1 hypothetical protein [Falsiroseomonas frigidaquae]
MNQLRLLVLGALAAFCLLGRPSQAQVVEVARSGDWINYEGRSSQGDRMCGIRSGGISSRSMFIKYFEGNNTFSFQIYNAAWTIPSEVNVRVAVELGSTYRSSDLQAIGHPREDLLPARVEFSVLFEGSGEFWTAFRQASTGRLIFLTGNEGSWRISLAGSNAATSTMSSCIQRLNQGTRPFDAGRVPGAQGSATSTPFDVPAGALKD